ncbi:MAG: GAF domain-containing protein, partial [Candidatus Methylomirabilales bacterium]
RFPPPQIDLLTAIGNQIGSALENARLYQDSNRKSNRIEAVNRLIAIAASTMEAQAILDGLTKGLVEHYQAAFARIWLAAREGDESVLLLKASAGMYTHLDGEHARVPYGAFKIGLIAESRMPTWTNDVQNDPRIHYPDWAKREGLISFAGYPLIAGDRMLGVLALFSKTKFDNEDFRLLGTFANQAAIAIEKARLLQESTGRAAQLEAMGELTRSISATLDPQEVFNFIVDAVVRLLDVVLARVWVVEEASGDLVRQVGAGDADLIEYPQARFRPGEGMVGRVLEEKETIAIYRPAEDPRYLLKEWAQAKGIKAVAGIPLLVGGRALGVLSATRRLDKPFSPEELRLLTSFADQAAIAIQNARLFQETQTRAEKLGALSELSRTITATLDLQQVFDLIIRASTELLDAPVATVWTLEGAELTLGAGRGLHSDLRVHRRFRLGEGLVGWIAKQKQSVVIPEFSQDPRLKNKEWAIAERFRAFAGFPLLVGNRCMGVLTVIRKSPEPFGAEEVELLTAFADQAAIAVENAKLYEQLRTRSVNLERVVRERTEELRRRNLELEEADRHKSAFLATMSHELRTPLNSIIGFSELLIDRIAGDLNPKQDRYVDNVLRSGRHLLNLINDILDLAKVESGRMDLQLEEVSVTKTLSEVIALIQPQAAKKGIALEFSSEADPPPITADPLRFRQILANLLSNAVKFTPPGGTVTVSARVQSPTSEVQSLEEADAGPWTLDSGEFVEISVTDTGIGIREEDLEKIFLPFVQVDASLARLHEGTGLGLTLTQRMIRMHGGRIWVESEGEGKGSRFTIRLPTKGG